MKTKTKKKKKGHRRQLLDRYQTLAFIRLLSDPVKRERILAQRRHPKELVRFIRNISRNVLERNIRLSGQDRERLSRYKQLVRALGSSQVKTPPKQFITQSGGFLGIILPIVASALGQYAASSLIKSKAIRV
jgi:hypothetical protein